MYQNLDRFFIKAVYLGLIMLISLSVSGQAKDPIDSIKNLLSRATGLTKYDLYYELTFQYLESNKIDLAQGSISQAQSIALQFGDSLKIIKSGRVKGQLLRRLDRTNESITELLIVLPSARRNKDVSPDYLSEFKDILNGLAIAYTFQANYDKALEYNFQSLVVRDLEGDKYEISVALNNIGFVYFKLKNFDKALEYYTNALNNINESGATKFKDRLLINIGLCYNQAQSENKSYRKAQEFINEGLSICRPNCDPVTEMEGKLGLGVSSLGLSKIDEAIPYFLESLKISKQLNDKRFQLENLLQLAAIQLIRTDISEARILLSEAEQIASGTEYNELLIRIYRMYSQLYTQLNDYANVAIYQGRYIHLKDSTYSDQLIKNLAKVQNDYEQRENLKTIRLNAENIKLKDEQIQRQRLQYFFIVLVATLIIVLALVLLWANRRQHIHNAALSEAKRVIEEQNKQLTVTNEELDHRVQEKTQDLFDTNETLIQVNDELDNFVYRTSHDLRGPLVTLKGVCNVAMMDVKDELAQDYLKRLDLTAAKLNAILTRLLVVNQVNHIEIEASKINLEFAIDEVIAFEKEKGIPSRLKIDYSIDPDVTLTSDIRLVKMILENLIDNGIKFYNTSERINPYVKVRISKGKRGNVKIYVEDNGIGINSVDKDEIFHLFVRASERSETGGIGLYLTKLASQRLGGGVKLLETSDKGSKFLVLLPGDINPILAKRKALEEQRLIEKARRERERKERGSQEDDEEDFI